MDKNNCFKCSEKINNMSNYNRLNCSHIFCVKCLCEHVKRNISSEIVCPQEGCLQLISDKIIRKCLSNSNLSLYDKACQPEWVVKCLIPDCPYVFTHMEEGFFECPICEQPNCLTCNSLHFKNQPCERSYLKNNFKEIGSAILLEKSRLNLLNISKNNVILNSEESECESCSDFLFPREGIILSSCLHNFCKKCLTDYLSGMTSIFELTCLWCEAPLTYNECAELIGPDNVEKLSLESVAHRFFECKTENCKYMCKVKNVKIVSCPKCKMNNCVPCNAIHEGISCKDYRKTETYKNQQQSKQTLDSQNQNKCVFCKKTFIKGEGCNAIKCDNCKKHICALTGKKVGPGGCNCTTDKRCHKDCKFGCIPE